MKRTMWAALGVQALGAVFGVLCACNGHPRPEPDANVRPLVQALASAKQPPSAIAAVQLACGGKDGCACAEAAARAALDADLHELATAALKAAPKACPHQANLLGERAEALARAGSESAQQAADLALKADPQNAYAELAIARIIYDKNKMGECSEHAEKAAKWGRGAEAERLLGRSALARGLYKEAEAHFQNVLKQNPNDAEAAFSAGVCADKLGDYLHAREAFLQTLRIDPKHVKARIYLVVLTHNVGANDEARHHLSKLAEILPKDAPELAQLQQLLAQPNKQGQDGETPSPAGLSQVNVSGILQGKQ